MSMAGGNTLIVDDESDVRLLLTLLINKENHGLHVVAEAASGQEAIDVHRDLDLDVVVLDHRMPGLTGLETASAMLAESPHLPIVLYSAFTDERMEAEAREIGVRAWGAQGGAPHQISGRRARTRRDAPGAPGPRPRARRPPRPAPRSPPARPRTPRSA